MRRTILWRAGIVAVLVAGGCLDSETGLGLTGIGAAEAKQYYTKKRVNGRWITGRFAKRSAGGHGAVDERTGEARSGSRPSRKVADAPAPAPSSPTPAASASRDTAALRPGSGQPFLQTQPAVPTAPLPSQPPATNAPLIPAPEGERLDRLRQALQARASSLTTGSAPSEPARQGPEPHSVSLDFQTGVKTTLFSDGTMVREPFDVAALKALAAAPADRKGAR